MFFSASIFPKLDFVNSRFTKSDFLNLVFSKLVFPQTRGFFRNRISKLAFSQAGFSQLWVSKLVFSQTRVFFTERGFPNSWFSKTRAFPKSGFPNSCFPKPGFPNRAFPTSVSQFWGERQQQLQKMLKDARHVLKKLTPKNPNQFCKQKYEFSCHPTPPKTAKGNCVTDTKRDYP